MVHALCTFQKPRRVYLGDNHFIEAHGTGQIILSTTRKGEQEQQIVIQDVHYVPELGESLLSVSVFIEQHNKVIFSTSGCKIRNANGQVIATGHKENGLFLMDATT